MSEALVHPAFAVSYSLLWVLVVVQGLLVVALMRRLDESSGVAAAAPGHPLVGLPAPAFELVETDSGRRLSLDLFGAGRGVLLFLSSSCGACQRLGEGLAARGEAMANVVVVWRERDASGAVAEAYGVRQYPTAFVIDAARVASVDTPYSADHVLALANGTVSVAGSRPVPGVESVVAPQH